MADEASPLKGALALVYWHLCTGTGALAHDFLCRLKLRPEINLLHSEQSLMLSGCLDALSAWNSSPGICAGCLALDTGHIRIVQIYPLPPGIIDTLCVGCLALDPDHIRIVPIYPLPPDIIDTYCTNISPAA